MVTLDTILDLRLFQHKSGYRFSADAVLLSAFVSTQRLKKIADFGAGSGIIGLLLAKKYPSAEITLIELQEGLVKLAEKNATLNGLEERVRIVHSDIKKLKFGQDVLHTYDLVVSNPPFRKTKTGLVSPSDEIAVARHEISLPIASLMKSALSLLKHHGRLCIIHLPERLAEVMTAMREHHLEPKRLRFVHSDAGSEAKMVLIEAVKEGKPGLLVENPLFMYSEAGEYTEEMLAIYGK